MTTRISNFLWRSIGINYSRYSLTLLNLVINPTPLTPDVWPCPDVIQHLVWTPVSRHMLMLH